MKKILCMLLVLVMCLGIFAGCGEPTVEYNLEAAKTFLSETYKNQNVAPTSDYDIAAKTVAAGVTYEVTWTTNNPAIVIKASEKANFVTVDVPEYNTTEFAFKLIATIKAPDGTTTTLELDRTLPVYDSRGIASEFEENKAYKMFVEQKTLSQTLYALNTTQSNDKYINTTNDPKAAADYYIEIVDGGYKFFTNISGVKNYVYAQLVTASDGHFSKYVGLDANNSTVFKYDTERKTFYADFGENGKYGFGTYSDYKTLCISEWSHFETVANIGTTQFVVQFMDKTVAESLAPDEEKEVTVKFLDGATAPVAGTKYILGFHHGGKDNAAYYLTGAMATGSASYYANTVTDKTQAANFYIEEVSGGFNLYAIASGAKVYVNFVQSGSYTNIKYEATATTVFTYDETLKTFKTTIGEDTFILGTSAAKTFTTVGPVKAADNNYYVQFVVSTNADQTAPEGGESGGSQGGTTPEPTPTPSNGIVFDFGANGTSGTHNDGTEISGGTKTYTSGNYQLVLTDVTKAYDGGFDKAGNSILKFGTSSVAGSITFVVPEDVTSVVIYAARYKNYADNNMIVVNGQTYTLTKNSDDGEYEAITVDTTTNKTVTVASTTDATKPRCVVNTIEFYINKD